MNERALQQSQVEVLGYLYSYRFCTCRQIAAHLGRKNHKGIQKKLQILEEHGLLGKRYDKSYKIAGRPAEYYLTPKGARRLRQYQDYAEMVDEKNIKLLYQNKTVSDGFVRHCLHIANAALEFKALYDTDWEIFTRADMAANTYLPTWKPDMYIASQDKAHPFFLDIGHEDVKFFLLVRKVRSYLKYIEEIWLPETFPRPCFLFVCESEKTKRRLIRQIERALEDFYDNETVFALTTRQQLEEALHNEDKIWQKVTYSNESEMMQLGTIIFVA